MTDGGRVSQVRPAVEAAGAVLWARPWERTGPLPVPGGGVHVMDLSGVGAACPGWGAGAQAAWCEQVAALCRGAALLLVGSAAEHGFWSGVMARVGVTAPLAIVPYVPALHAVPEGAPERLVVAGDLANPAFGPVLEAAWAWAGANGWPVQALHPSLAGAALLDPPSEGPAVLLDLREDLPLERVSTPAAVLDALGRGWPVLTAVDGALGQALQAAEAGLVVAGKFRALPAGAAAAAWSFAAGADPGEALGPVLDRAVRRDQAARAAWAGANPPRPLGPGGRVLVVSDEPEGLLALRVHLPFGTLRRRGAIGGYAVLSEGELVFDTAPAGAEAPFDAVWLHRTVRPATQYILRLLGRRFGFDLDDNLLVSPAYRDRFHSATHETAAGLLGEAAVVSCSTARLAGLLGQRAGLRLAEKTVVTPNLCADPPAERAPGVARAVVWASSDRPALLGDRAAVVRAVRDFCLAHGLRLLCIGAVADEGFAGSGVQVEELGLLPPAQYRETLRALSPSIMVCPLETGADTATQDFIDGKSDVKLLEAAAAGLVPVCSRARPFTETDLPAPILCDNTYDDWVAGLERARQACLSPGPVTPWPAERDPAGFGVAPWAAALERVRLPAPLPMAEVRAAVRAVRRQAAAPIGREQFDEADYLDNYDDVRRAVADGTVPSGFDHWLMAGREEGRLARARQEGEAADAQWWAVLQGQIGQMEEAARLRAARIEALERRVGLRRVLTR